MNETQNVFVKINGEIVEKTAIVQQEGFNPNTGEPVMVLKIQKGFNGQTGEPLYKTIERAGFDPQTGNPVYVIKGDNGIRPSASGTAGRVKTVTASSLGTGADAKSESGIGNIINSLGQNTIIAIAAGAVALVVVIVVLMAVVFSNRNKVAMATMKTLKEDTFGGVLLDAADVVSNQDLTVELSGKYDVGVASGDITAQYSQDISDSKIGANVDIDIAGIKQEAIFYYDNKVIEVAAPDLIDTVFMYDYTKDNEGGIIAEIVDEETAGKIEDVNTILSTGMKLAKDTEKYNKKLKRNIKKVYKDIEVDKCESKKVEIDGKDRKCKGYKVVITGENVADLLRASQEASEAAYGDDLDELVEAVSILTGEDFDRHNPLSSFYGVDEDELEEIEDEGELFEIYVYIYKGKLAAVETDDFSVEFNGGDNRASNMTIDLGYDTITRVSEMDGSVEEGKIKANGETIVKYSYNKRTGEFKLSDGELGIAGLGGVFQVKGKKILMEFKYEEMLAELSATASIEKGARVKKPSGDTFDVGDASMDDIEDIIEEAERTLEAIGEALEYLL